MTPTQAAEAVRDEAGRRAEIHTLGMDREHSKRLIAAIRSIPIPAAAAPTQAAAEAMRETAAKVARKRADGYHTSECERGHAEWDTGAFVCSARGGCLCAEREEEAEAIADLILALPTEAAEPGELEKELATFKAVVTGSRECADYWLAQCATLRADLARMKSALEKARKQIETWRDETKAAMETVTGESWVWHDGRATSLSDVLTIITAALQEPTNANR